jgi:hypothetical protein
VVLGGDEVLDSVQEITAMLEVRSSIPRVPCNSVSARLELDDPSMGCWTRRSAAISERTGRRLSYHGIQEDNASLVARFARSRCPGASEISCQSPRLVATRSDHG